MMKYEVLSFIVTPMVGSQKIRSRSTNFELSTSSLNKLQDITSKQVQLSSIDLLNAGIASEIKLSDTTNRDITIPNGWETSRLIWDIKLKISDDADFSARTEKKVYLQGYTDYFEMGDQNGINSNQSLRKLDEEMMWFINSVVITDQFFEVGHTVPKERVIHNVNLLTNHEGLTDFENSAMKVLRPSDIISSINQQKKEEEYFGGDTFGDFPEQGETLDDTSELKTGIVSNKVDGSPLSHLTSTLNYVSQANSMNIGQGIREEDGVLQQAVSMASSSESTFTTEPFITYLIANLTAFTNTMHAFRTKDLENAFRGISQSIRFIPYQQGNPMGEIGSDTAIEMGTGVQHIGSNNEIDALLYNSFNNFENPNAVKEGAVAQTLSSVMSGWMGRSGVKSIAFGISNQVQDIEPLIKFKFLPFKLKTVVDNPTEYFINRVFEDLKFTLAANAWASATMNNRLPTTIYVICSSNGDFRTSISISYNPEIAQVSKIFSIPILADSLFSINTGTVETFDEINMQYANLSDMVVGENREPMSSMDTVPMSPMAPMMNQNAFMPSPQLNGGLPT